MERTEIAIIVIVVLIAFGAVLYFFGFKSEETVIENNLLVKSKDPAGDIAERLSLNPVVVEQRLFAMNDSRNSAIAIMSSEISRGIAMQGWNVSVYAVVEGGSNICGTANCTGSVILIQSGGCDCMRFTETQLVIEGGNDFLMQQSVRVGRLIGFALSQAGK
ncbi:MAG TPA: hypothetical protein VJI71_01985 [Candidatus Norongarragalinales archaeon]|nr:hypothetical protein [Candidatus Norongarragalinales archaeon]